MGAWMPMGTGMPMGARMVTGTRMPVDAGMAIWVPASLRDAVSGSAQTRFKAEAVGISVHRRFFSSPAMTRDRLRSSALGVQAQLEGSQFALSR